MTLKIIYAFIALVLMTAFSFKVYATGSITVTGEVQRIYPHDNRVHFRLKADDCEQPRFYYYFTLGTEVEKAWYALLLAAASTGKPVSVALPACPTSEHVQIRYIYQDF